MKDNKPTEKQKRQAHSDFFISKTIDALEKVKDTLYYNLLDAVKSQDPKIHKEVAKLRDQYFVQALQNLFTVSIFELGIKDPNFDIESLLNHFSKELFPLLIERWKGFHPGPPEKLNTVYDKAALNDILTEIIKNNS